jgi:adenylylsulfate kinase
MIIWIIGLSASGKTTLGKQIYNIWKKEECNTVFVDGDEIRAIFNHDKGEMPYTVEGRRENSSRLCNICAWLDCQDINVVCCVLSIFEESRFWNRQNYSRYFEVYIDTPMELLEKRDKRKLYKRALNGKVKNVVGVDISFEPPKNPDYIFDNSIDNIDFRAVALDILTKAKDK